MKKINTAWTGASFVCILLVGYLITVPRLVLAQAPPSAAEMVEQLTAKPAPRTRGLRNLSVEAAEQSKPTLSLLIQFDLNSARVLPESQQALINLAQAMQSKELADVRFAIEGHTDAKGRADYNLKLSEQRANAVSAVLASHGVTSARLAAVGKGATEPANAADPLAAENRRVRIVNLN